MQKDSKNNLISFNDGMWDLHSLEFVTDTLSVNQSNGACFVNESNAKTPQWDAFIGYQLNESDKYLLEVLIGRLFYVIGQYDDWQVMPVLLGRPWTGKSCVLHLVQRMFPDGSTGDIEYDTRLESLSSKRVVFIDDWYPPPSGDRALDIHTFRSAICGESISVPSVSVPSISVPSRRRGVWKIPMLLTGNYFTDYEQALERHLAVFRFDNRVRVYDHKIISNIFRDELHAIMIKCIRAYRVECTNPWPIQ